MSFKKAVRKQAKIRLGIAAPSGAGKTLGALMVAKGIGGRIAVIDTERGSASLYASPVRLSDGSVWEPPEFDTMELSAPYTPEKFISAIQEAERAGYNTLIIDSMTHEWNGVGGCMEMVDQLAATKYRGNTWSAFSEVTPRHRKFIDTMLGANLHIIATARSKTETTQTEEGGRKRVVKLGMKAEQRDGLEYEFTSFVDISHDGHFAIASKDRTGVFSVAPSRLSEQTGRNLISWLESGAVDVRERKVAPDDWMQSLEEKIRNAPSAEEVSKMRAFVRDRMISEEQESHLVKACDETERKFSPEAATLTQKNHHQEHTNEH